MRNLIVPILAAATCLALAAMIFLAGCVLIEKNVQNNQFAGGENPAASQPQQSASVSYPSTQPGEANSDATGYGQAIVAPYETTSETTTRQMLRDLLDASVPITGQGAATSEGDVGNE